MSLDPAPSVRELRERVKREGTARARIATATPSKRRKATPTHPVEEAARYEAGLWALTLREPPSANRWWRNVSGRMVLSREAREYKQRVQRLVEAAWGPMLTQDVRVRVFWHRGRKSGDLDKRLGVLLDALQGTVYENDSQVVNIEAHRYEWPESPRAVVWVDSFSTSPAPAGRTDRAK